MKQKHKLTEVGYFCGQYTRQPETMREFEGTEEEAREEALRLLHDDDCWFEAVYIEYASGASETVGE